MSRASTISSCRQPLHAQRGFTLVELLVAVSIVMILASVAMMAMYSAQESARIAKTKATVAKLNSVIMKRWEAYRTRRVPLSTQQIANIAQARWPNTPLTGKKIATIRLDALRELMRLELPDRWTDLTDNPVTLTARPGLNQGYLQKFNTAGHTDLNAGAECLYLIVTQGAADEMWGREHFAESEIADVDNDRMPEFVDAWGNPIMFLRWAPGFSPATPSTTPASGAPSPSELQNGLDPDPFDSRHAYPSSSEASNGTFALFPLIYSAGPDEIYDIKRELALPAGQSPPGPALQYSTANNNPFTYDPTDSSYIGVPLDLPVTSHKYGVVAENNLPNYFDNIHNHLLGLR